MVTIHYKDGRPFYEQVKDGIRQLMLTGVLRPGDKLPSVRELAGQLAINPNTIQRAYRELETEGFIVSVPGRGSFAAQRDGEDLKRRRELLDKLRETARELRWLGASEEDILEAIGGDDHD